MAPSCVGCAAGCMYAATSLCPCALAHPRTLSASSCAQSSDSVRFMYILFMDAVRGRPCLACARINDVSVL